MSPEWNEPWIDFAEEAIRKALGDTPFESIAPPRVLAFGLIAFYLGIDLFMHLESDESRLGELFEAVRGVRPFLDALGQLKGGS